MDSSGAIREVATSGCAKGFDALEPFCSHLFRSVRIGNSLVRAAFLRDLLDCLAPVIRAQPELTRCSAECLRCHDAVLGGPLPPQPVSK
jgi:aminoglycoside 3-N-acetyltransferase